MSSKIYYGKKEIDLPRYPLPHLLSEQAEDGEAIYRHKRKLILSDPGQGKTLTALQAMVLIEDEFEERQRQSTNVILCPSIALRNWAIWIAVMYENCGFADPQIQIIKSGKDPIYSNTTHVICSYGAISRKGSPIYKKLREWEYDYLICDECDYLANYSALRTERVYGKGNVTGLIHKATWFAGLTGTPIPRYADGLYPALKGAFGQRMKAELGVSTLEGFIDKFCHTRLVRYGQMRIPQRKVIGSKNMSVLRNFLYKSDPPIAVRRKLVLPNGFHEREVFIEVKESQELRKLTIEAMESSIDDAGSLNINTAAGSKAAHLLGVEKAPAVVDYVASQLKSKRSKSDERAMLVLYWHTDAGETIRKGLDEQGYLAAVISGGMDPMKRGEVQDLMNNGELDVVVAQIQAAGTAIDMQHNCNHVVFAERDWSHSRQLQALQRVWRRGQDAAVQVDYCTSENELEGQRKKVTQGKKSQAKQIIDGG